MMNLVRLTLMPGIHYVYARPEMHESLSFSSSWRTVSRISKCPGGMEEQTNRSLPGSFGCVLRTSQEITEVIGVGVQPWQWQTILLILWGHLALPPQSPTPPCYLQCPGRRVGPLMEPAVSSPFTWKADGRKGRATVWTIEDNVQGLQPNDFNPAWISS